MVVKKATKRVKLIRALLGCGALGLVGAGVYAYLSVAGVVHVGLARIILSLTWLVAVVAVVVSETVWGTRHRVTICVSSGIVLAAGFIYLDHWAVRHRTENAPFPTSKEIAGEVWKEKPSENNEARPAPRLPATKNNNGPAKIVHPRDILSMRAFVTYGYPVGKTVAGINWIDGIKAIRLVIDSQSQFPIQNVDLTIEVEKGMELLWGMGQISEVKGCRFSEPDLPDIGLSVLGTDGQRAKIMMRDFSKEMSHVSTSWKVFCDKLIPGDELRLLVAACKAPPKLTVPRTLKVTGSYEMMPSEGSTREKVVRVVDVESSQEASTMPSARGPANSVQAIVPHQVDAGMLANAMKGFPQLEILVRGNDADFQQSLVGALQLVIPHTRTMGIEITLDYNYEGIKVYANDPPISVEDRGPDGARALVAELKRQNFVASFFPAKEWRSGKDFEPNFVRVVVGRP
jgi:hypothetical protein